jgi:peptidoglycan/xylan/chitin deacetylase (PgdA/CDA1 family)
MRYIKENSFKTLTLTEMVDIWNQKIKEPYKAVVLTFDDGYLNNYDVAFPILKAFGLTATIFLTTDFIGKRCTWDKKEGIPDLHLLTWEMIREMHHYDIDFQPHSATHPHLTNLTVSQIEEEIKRSKQAIEKNLGKECRLFCYPYGESDERVVNILIKLGFTAAVAGQPAQEDLYSLRRIGSAHLTSPLAFKTALKGRFSAYYFIKKTARSLLRLRSL